MKTTSKFAILLAFCWLGGLLYLGGSFYQPDDSEQTAKELKRVLRELHSLKQQNDRLQNGAIELALQEGTSEKCGTGPSIQHEKLRRKIENGVTEFWFYVQSELKKIQERSTDQSLKDKIDIVLQDAGHQQRSILTDLYNISNVDDTGKWKLAAAKALSDKVQRRFYYLQNPVDCDSAKKLVCNLNKGCGYGCQVHHVAYCLILAYGTQRTLVLESRGWRYSSEGWERWFMPLSNTCHDRKGGTTGRWGRAESMESIQVVDLPIVDGLHPKPDFLPLAVPADLAKDLVHLHGHPIVWWIGQVLKYILRPSKLLQQHIEEMEGKHNFEHPIVGVHVRRTDKVGTEAAFHDISEYMKHVEEYYELIKRRQTVKKKRVYLATDDPGLLEETRKRYPEYHFISDNDISKSASINQRYSDNSLRGVILDIHFLANSDFLVCTFSSQVCRVAYEIMQTLHPDASSYFRSLDDIYYFGGQNEHRQRAIYAHEPRDSSETRLSPGDFIAVAGNHWDGYSKGTNRNIGTSKAGLYPSYKVEDKIDTAIFPTYKEAENYKIPS
ncbi:alpha-(1,6)-fucosyltransferase-like isoform X2 [Anneissia japonica]|uniref:alpha-(1,6)-fucosyltransferase-like isoform X2 n=1 Tax=Anneissia japonica TaxID=1529436 RepID=UPI00142576FB|nr:alpha-(1,6)-fucosyltransferase-like isoform X2 [Anneissia japonica]